MAGAMVPDANPVADKQNAIGRQMTRLRGVADINDKMMDDSSLISRERLERRQ